MYYVVCIFCELVIDAANKSTNDIRSISGWKSGFVKITFKDYDININIHVWIIVKYGDKMKKKLPKVMLKSDSG